MYLSDKKAITSVEAKTRRIAIYSLKNSLLKIPIQVAGKSFRRVPKPFLVLGLFLTCAGIYLLLQGASSSTPILIPKHFASRKHRQHFRQIQKPPSNEEGLNERYAANSNNEAAEWDNLDERNHKAIPQKRVVIIKRKRHDDKQSHRIERGKLGKNPPKYYKDNLHPEWVFNISQTYDENHLHYWTEPNYTVPKSKRWTQGENGTGFVPQNGEEEAEMRKLLARHNYNIFASERISLRRSLPDYRYPECRELDYPDRLPNVSIIIVMHNEAWSTILRTIWSVIDRSPHELLHEIIIVDDVSTWNFLKRPLDDFIDMIDAPIRIIRTTKREGLIRARLIGAKNATGDILVFFDAHTECSQGWLQPIAARIASDRSVVAVPIIDGVESDDMRYLPARNTTVSGLRWHLLFNVMNISQSEMLRTKGDRTAPIRTPTHIGCAFAIDRKFFFEIGSYDTGMDIWGGENVEMAFRVWLCGGSLEIIQCSRVGHLFRISTYSFDGDQTEITARNTKRLVEVWMDEFKELFYAANPKSRTIAAGNLTERIELRQNLKCKNFRWYLEHVYPDSSWLRQYNQMGQFKSVSKRMCLDIDSTGMHRTLRLWPCHGSGENDYWKQFFAFQESGLIVTAEEICVGVNEHKQVILVHCTDDDKTKLWTYDKERIWIMHIDTGLCMQNRNRDVILGDCKLTDERSQWVFRASPTGNIA